MFIKNEDLTLLKMINADIHNTKLGALIDRLEKDIEIHGNSAKEKIRYMRGHGYPYYARSRKVQEKHYKACFEDIRCYIENNEISTAMTMLNRYISENNYSAKQLIYFMQTIPKDILEIYDSYNK